MISLRKSKTFFALLLMLALLVSNAVSVGASELTVIEPEEPEELRYADLEPGDIIAASAIVMDAATGEVLFEKAAYEKRAMASTTKVMTALIAVEQGNIGREVTITDKMLEYDEEGSTKLGLSINDRITMHDLIVTMMLLSGNDAAQSVAVEIGGSLDGFASIMNEKAAELGMFDSHFITPSGLDDEAHYSTAYDMALLAIAAMDNPEMAYFCSMPARTIRYGFPEMEDRYMLTHNYLLEGQMYGYEGCNGLKTGYTDSAGYCLVSQVERDGVELVCVTLGGWRNGYRGCWSDHKALYDYALEQYVDVAVEPELDRESVVVVGGTQQAAAVEVVGSGKLRVHESVVDQITKRVNLNRFEYAPVSQGQIAGSVQYLYGTRVIAEFPIVITQDVDCSASDWLSAYVAAVGYELELNHGFS